MDFQPAGLLLRFVAAFIDAIILLIALYALSFVIFLGLAGAAGRVGAAMALSLLVGLGLSTVYFALLESSSLRGTLGKVAVGIEVTDRNGETLTIGEALWRHLGRLVSLMTLGAGFAMAGFTHDGAALHDRIFHTRVVIKKEVFDAEL